MNNLFQKNGRKNMAKIIFLKKYRKDKTERSDPITLNDDTLNGVVIVLTFIFGIYVGSLLNK